MTKCATGDWVCVDCDYTHSKKQKLQYHIEAKHINSPGHACDICEKICPTKNALYLHRSRYHKNGPLQHFLS